MEPLTFTYRPISEDYVVPLRTHWRRRPFFIIAFTLSGLLALFFIGITIFGVVLTLTSGMSSKDISSSLMCNVFPLICAATFGMYPLIFWVIVPASGAKVFQRDEHLQAETTWSLDDDGIRITTRFEEHKIDWGTFHQVQETKDYYLLVMRAVKMALRAVPKRAFTSADQEMAFREIAQRHLGPIK
jgi:hypothetical protein